MNINTDNRYIPILWEARFETGISEMDKHHKVLVSILNEAGMVIAANTGKEKLLDISRHLLEYAHYHFDQEEQLMQQYDYYEYAAEEAEQHKKEHAYFSEWIVTFREQLRSGDPISPHVLLNFVHQWLFEHIMCIDKKLGAHIAKHK